jgi:hypothetical protein
MADPRPVHHHIATSLYGAHGPVNGLQGPTPRPLTTKLQWPAGQPVAPQSIAEHLDSAIARIPGLSARERQAVHAVLTEKLRDIHFLRLLTAELGPPKADEGRVL